MYGDFSYGTAVYGGEVVVIFDFTYVGEISLDLNLESLCRFTGIYTGQVVSAFNLESLYRQEYTYTGQVISVFNLESLYRQCRQYTYTSQIISIFDLESLYKGEIMYQGLLEVDIVLGRLFALKVLRLKSLVEKELELVSLVR